MSCYIDLYCEKHDLYLLYVYNIKTISNNNIFMDNLTEDDRQKDLITQQYVLIDKLLTKVEKLKKKVDNLQKRGNNLKTQYKNVKNEADMYKDYCKDITYIKWRD
jgi:hypothetical protein